MKIMTSGMFLIGLVALSPLSWAASFDCGQDGLSQIERTICGDDELSALDDEMHLAYKIVRHNPEERKNQFEWLKYRNSSSGATSLKFIYLNRLKQIYEKRAKAIVAHPLIPGHEGCKLTLALIDNEYSNLDRKMDLNGDLADDVIFASTGCSVYCGYTIYRQVNGCYEEVLSFSAREYFVYLEDERDELVEFLGSQEAASLKASGVLTENCYSYLVINVQHDDDNHKGPNYKTSCLFENKP